MPKISLSKPPTLSQIAEKVGGTLHGNPDAQVLGLCPLDDPQPDHLGFFSKTGTTGLKLSQQQLSKLAALIIPSQSPLPEALCSSNLILVKNPQSAIIELIPVFFEPRRIAAGIHPSACLSDSVKLGQDLCIGPFCAIGDDVVIGDRVVIHPHVTIYAGVTIGADCVIHSGVVIREEVSIASGCVIQNGAVIGADGFGYIPDPQLGLRHVPQIGSVELAERVEVGANACIDRAALGMTQVGTGTKIDNLVQVGHNCQIGSHSILCGQVGVGGSTRVGNQVVLGGMVGVADHVEISDRVRVAGKSGVTGNLNEIGDYAGFPARPAGLWRRQEVLMRKLPDLMKRLGGE